MLTSSNGSLYRLAFAVADLPQPPPPPPAPIYSAYDPMNFQRRGSAVQTSSLAPGTAFNVEAPEPRKSKRDGMKSFVPARCTALFRPAFFPPICLLLVTQTFNASVNIEKYFVRYYYTASILRWTHWGKYICDGFIGGNIITIIYIVFIKYTR